MRAVYVTATPADQPRASELGLGLILDASAEPAYAYLQGGGLSFRLPEPVDMPALSDAIAEILAAEQAAEAAADIIRTNRETLQGKTQQALTANQDFLALATPTNAQTLAQVRLLTRECSALIRLLLQQLDSTDGT